MLYEAACHVWHDETGMRRTAPKEWHGPSMLARAERENVLEHKSEQLNCHERRNAAGDELSDGKGDHVAGGSKGMSR